jgi:hypothetical protein
MSWITELAKVENDTLRTTGDVSGIISKYSAPDGPRTWRDAPFGDFVSIVGDQWMKDLTDAQRDALLDTHTDATGNVTLSNGPTRAAIAPLLDAQQATQMQDGFSTQGTLSDTLGLPRLTEDVVVRTLSELEDSPQGTEVVRWALIKQIRNNRDLLLTTSVANLTTINSLMGL